MIQTSTIARLAQSQLTPLTSVPIASTKKCMKVTNTAMSMMTMEIEMTIPNAAAESHGNAGEQPSAVPMAKTQLRSS